MAVTRHYKRSPWAQARGFTQFKLNMQKMAKVADTNVMKDGFVGIAQDIRTDMNIKLRIKLKPESGKYLRWKQAMIRKRKSGSTHVTSLRRKGIVAKKFKSPGKNIAFVAIHYKYAPNAYWIEFGTAERVTLSGAERGKIPGAKSGFRPGYFRPTVNEWRRSGRYVNRVERTVRTAVDASAKRLPM